MPALGRSFVLVCAVLVATVAAFWPTVASLVVHWEDTVSLSYTHGYAIVAVCAWLLWRARGRIAALPPRPWWPAVPALAATGVPWYLALASGIQIGHQVLLPVLMIGAIAAVGGIAIARACAFPVGYLYFAIPVWGVVNGALQSLTTAAVTVVLRVTGIPAYVEGNFVHIPAGTFEIAGGCSGLHFVIVALAIAALQGEIERVALRTRVLLLCIAAAMSVVTNWVRVYGVILNGYLTDMQGYLVVVDHYVYGWVLFALMMALYFWLTRRMLAAIPLADDAPASNPVAAAWPWAAGVATIAALAVGPALAAVAQRHASGGAATLALPAGVDGWQGPVPTDSGWAPQYPGADGSALASYRRDVRAVEVYVNMYRHQGQGHELVGYGNDLLHGLSRDYAVSTFLVVGDRRLDGELASKLYYALDVLRRPTPSGIVAVAVRCDADCNAASGTADEFLERHADGLAAVITGSVGTK